MKSLSTTRLYLLCLFLLALISTGCLKVTGSNPSDGADGVARDSEIKILFNLGVKASTVNSESIVLKETGTGKVVACTFAVADKEVTVRPVQKLAISREYSLSVLSGIKSTLGLALKNGASFGFKTKEGSWSSPEPIWEPGTVAGFPYVVMNNSEKAAIIWEQKYDEKYLMRLFKTEYTEGKWDKPVQLMTSMMCGNDPKMAMNDRGDMIIIWLVYDYHPFFGPKYSLVKKQFRAGVWDDDEVITENSVGIDWYKIAMDSNGDAIIVWEECYCKSFMIECRNGYWGNIESIGAPDSYPSDPHVAMSETGKAIIVWQESRGLSYWINKMEYSGSSWEAPEFVSKSCNPQDQPHISMNAKGDAIIVWAESTPDPYIIDLCHTELIDGKWSGVTATGLKMFFSIDDFPLNNLGEAFLMLDDNDREGYKIDGQLGDLNKTPEKIDDDRNGCMFPSAVMNDYGDAIIVWEGDEKIFMKERRKGTWHDNRIISLQSAEGSYHPTAGLDNNGNAIVVWTHEDDNGSCMYKTEYR